MKAEAQVIDERTVGVEVPTLDFAPQAKTERGTRKEVAWPASTDTCYSFAATVRSGHDVHRPIRNKENIIMKKRILNKRLMLNRETLSALTSTDLRQAGGGETTIIATYEIATCPTCKPNSVCGCC